MTTTQPIDRDFYDDLEFLKEIITELDEAPTGQRKRTWDAINYDFGLAVEQIQEHITYAQSVENDDT